MYIPDWAIDVKTGNERIDIQHVKLFEHIDQFMGALSYHSEPAVIQETLNFLILHVRNHFAEEERMHRESGAPNLDCHVRAHLDVARELDSVLLIYRNEGFTPNMEMRLMNGVLRGMVAQMHEFDLPLARFLQENGRGN